MTDLNLQNQPKSWDRPEDASFEEWCNSRIARYSTRQYDWNALKFQADYDPKYRRAQMRYIGTGRHGDHIAVSENGFEAFAVLFQYHLELAAQHEEHLFHVHMQV